jgi:hypothetical protein
VLRAQLRDRAFTYPWHAVPDGQYPRPSQFGEAPRMPICCKSTTVRGFIGSKMILRALPSLLAGAPILMLDNQAPPHYSPRPSAIHGCNPKVCAGPGSGHRAVLTNPVRCILPTHPQVWIHAAQPLGLSPSPSTAVCILHDDSTDTWLHSNAGCI